MLVLPLLSLAPSMWSQSTLADSFLADFEDEAEEEEEELRGQRGDGAGDGEGEGEGEGGMGGSAQTPSTSDFSEPSAFTSQDDASAMTAGQSLDGGPSDPSLSLLPLSRPPSSLSPLLTSSQLPSHVASLSRLLSSSHVPPEREMSALSSSIRWVAAIDSELLLVHRHLCQSYGARYGELEQLVQSPVDYARIVRLLGNFEEDAVGLREKEKELQAFLPHPVVLTITVTATTSAGRRLTEAEWERVVEASDTLLSLHRHRCTLVAYMESRMALIAPNLSALVDSTVAAHLLSVAGSLRRLSEIPACNLQVLGTKKQRQTALSSIAQDLHVGVIGQCEVMRSCPSALRRRAVRLLAGKVTLACRMDEFEEDRTGERGRQLRREVEAKIDKWQEPPPSSLTKALPVPLAQSNKRRRGGKRYRKERERSQLSELHKAKHRMAFGKEELVDEYTGEEFGMIGREGSGTVKAPQHSTGQGLKQRLSKDMQKRMAYGQGKGGGGGAGGTVTVGGRGGGGGAQSVGGSVTVIGGGGGGTASSIAFTPVQGMELVNNEQKRMKAEAGEKYFASTASFVKVGNKAGQRTLPPVPAF